MSVYYALIIFPIIFMGVMSFIFQSSLQEIDLQQLRLNCPYPIYSGNATVYDIDSGNQVLYTVVYGSGTYSSGVGSNDWGSNFICYDANAGIANSTVAPTVTVGIKNYGATFFDVINYGWFGFISDGIVSFFDKVSATFAMIYLYINAPAVVSGLPFFSYINGILLGFISLGAFMVIRGTGG
jgi:hypothetical protein